MLFSGLIGTPFSLLSRLELPAPGVQYIHVADSQLYNSIITVHTISVIFFMIMPALIGDYNFCFCESLPDAPDKTGIIK
jgi:heme/copper-type cytochrome/quinol oxidase subunit 1